MMKNINIKFLPIILLYSMTFISIKTGAMKNEKKTTSEIANPKIEEKIEYAEEEFNEYKNYKVPKDNFKKKLINLNKYLLEIIKNLNNNNTLSKNEKEYIEKAKNLNKEIEEELKTINQNQNIKEKQKANKTQEKITKDKKIAIKERIEDIKRELNSYKIFGISQYNSIERLQQLKTYLSELTETLKYSSIFEEDEEIANYIDITEKLSEDIEDILKSINQKEKENQSENQEEIKIGRLEYLYPVIKILRNEDNMLTEIKSDIKTSIDYIKEELEEFKEYKVLEEDDKDRLNYLKRYLSELVITLNINPHLFGKDNIKYIDITKKLIENIEKEIESRNSQEYENPKENMMRNLLMKLYPNVKLMKEKIKAAFNAINNCEKLKKVYGELKIIMLQKIDPEEKNLDEDELDEIDNNYDEYMKVFEKMKNEVMKNWQKLRKKFWELELKNK